MGKVSSVDEYILSKNQHEKMLIVLNDIISSVGLEVSIKWGGPVYSHDNKNIVGLGAFKSYVALWFFQGALLSDKKKKLINAQTDKTKALRQWRFNTINEIDEKVVVEYLKEAIDNQKKGIEIKPDRNKPLIIPSELEKAFSKDQNIKICFEKFSLSKKREFTDYIIEAKREETRLKRLDKVITFILENRGLNDKYKK